MPWVTVNQAQSCISKMVFLKKKGKCMRMIGVLFGENCYSAIQNEMYRR